MTKHIFFMLCISSSIMIAMENSRSRYPNILNYKVVSSVLGLITETKIPILPMDNNPNPWKNLGNDNYNEEPNEAFYWHSCLTCQYEFSSPYKTPTKSKHRCIKEKEVQWGIPKNPTLFYDAVAICPESGCQFQYNGVRDLSQVIRFQEQLQIHCKKEHGNKYAQSKPSQFSSWIHYRQSNETDSTKLIKNKVERNMARDEQYKKLMDSVKPNHERPSSSDEDETSVKKIKT